MPSNTLAPAEKLGAISCRMHLAASGAFDAALEHVRGTLGHFRAASGEARNCPKAPERVWRCSKHFRAVLSCSVFWGP
eukprot:9369661-Alexandrium_andersonii.AAC.1